jgi:hypothetical protein
LGEEANGAGDHLGLALLEAKGEGFKLTGVGLVEPRLDGFANAASAGDT